MNDDKKDFIAYAIECNVLKFGNFILKSGRQSPYFFNTGLFNTGGKLRELGEFYAKALSWSNLVPDILYGPAYKGIPLVSSVAMAYSSLGEIDIPFAFNRKETKDHGEGGDLIGAPLVGNVVIVDDVITAGTSVKESIDIITKANARPIGVLVSLDRQEKGSNNLSAIEEIRQNYGIPVIPIITLDDIIDYLVIADDTDMVFNRVLEYQKNNSGMQL